jgi:UDP-4-amino-4-deoxy-L-arabinose-oxoglutarate aminotransferase
MTKSAADRYHGRFQHYDMVNLGWKYNMNNIQAGLLLNQLDIIEERLKRRKSIWEKYERAFSRCKEIGFPKVLPETKSARHLFTIWVDPKKRDIILGKLKEQKIGVAVNFRPIHLMKFYRDKFGYKRGMFPIAEKIGDRTVSLPLYPKLSDKEVQFVIQGVKKAVS